jgi:2-methylisocitrate lyase-like PEP mutase family enzyme
MTAQQPNAADVFRRLHQEGILVLANAWDAGTARLVESLGAKAIATTSAAVAWSHGYPDGDLLPVPLLVATVRDIVRVIGLPLSVDMEGGFSSDPAAVGEAVGKVLEAGAVGINIEDGAGSPDLLCAKIEQAKRAGTRLGVNLFVNARADVYLRDLAPRERRVAETVARGELYRSAGADGLFVPGVAEPAEIKAIASAVPLPLNVLARPKLPPAAELAALGVRRLSAGSDVAEVAYGRIADAAAAFIRDGVSDVFVDGAMPYAEIQTLLSTR